MKCTNHPEIEADGMCVYCGKPFCKDCLVEVKGKFYCKNDIGNVIDEAKKSAASQPTINITNSNESTNTNVNNNVGILAPRKSRFIALILCIIGLFGIGGLHRFYVGKIGSGAVHLVTCGICYVGTIFDLICILAGTFRDSYGQPLA